MPLLAYDAAKHESLKDDVNLIIPDFSPSGLKMFLDLSEATDHYKVEWVDEELKGAKDELQADINSVATTVTIGSGAKKFIVNSKTYIQIDSEYMLVTAGAGTNSLTVTRGQLGSSAAAHTAGAQVLMNLVEDEGFDANRDDSQNGTKAYNFTQIFSRQVIVTGTSQSVNSVGNSAKMQKQTAKQMKACTRDLAHAVFNNSSRYADGDESMRMFGGFPYWVTNKIPQNGNVVAPELIDDIIIDLKRSGADASDLIILAADDQVKRFNAMKIARVAGGGMSDESKIIRNTVTQYEFADAQVGIANVTELPSGTVYIGQKSNVKVHPMVGRAMKVQPLGKTGDNEKSLLVGEYTCVFRNAAETWTQLNGLA